MRRRDSAYWRGSGWWRVAGARGVPFAPIALLSGFLGAATIVNADDGPGQMIVDRTSADDADRFRSWVAEASKRFLIPADWIWAVMHIESAGDVRARSNKGAMGLMQIMPATWDMLRHSHGLGDDPYDPRDNILAGAAYLRDLHDRYGARGFLAAYNAGPGRYEDYLAGRRSLPAETVDYVSKVGRRIDFGNAPDAAPPAYARIAAHKSALFPRTMFAPSADQSVKEERAAARSPADQSANKDRAPTVSFSGRVAVDLSALAPSSAGLFARVTSR